MIKGFFCFALLLFSLSIPAYNPIFPNENYSVSLGPNSSFSPHKDFSWMGGEANVSIPLKVYSLSQKKNALSLNWRMVKSVFGFGTAPQVEYLTFRFHRAMLRKNLNESATTFYGGNVWAGFSVVLEYPEENYGMALETGAAGGVRPFEWLEVSLPTSLRLFQNGFLLQGKLEPIFFIPAMKAGISPGIGFRWVSRFRFDQMGFRPFFSIHFGAEF